MHEREWRAARTFANFVLDAPARPRSFKLDQALAERSKEFRTSEAEFKKTLEATTEAERERIDAMKRADKAAAAKQLLDKAEEDRVNLNIKQNMKVIVVRLGGL